MAYDKETDRYMSDEELRKLNRERKRALNRVKHDEAQARKRLEHANNQVRVREKIGTPVGNKQRMQEFKNMLLRDNNGSRVINKTVAIAMNDEHPGQVAALKMCMDRMLPVSLFDEKGSSGMGNITIVIGSVDAKEEPRVVNE